MIEIKRRNEYWEAYIDGALFHYHSDLEDLLSYLLFHLDEIKIELDS